MEALYLYCAFSYLFMAYPCVTGLIDRPVGCIVAFLFAPVVMPIMLGMAIADSLAR
jgi:hypothetical protein